jgi:hypothetical protein
MKKISKSNTTPEMEQRDKEARVSLLNKECMHFAPGTYITKRGRGKGLVVSREGRRLMVLWSDGFEVIWRNENQFPW